VVLKPENLEKLKSCGVSFLDAPEEIFATVLNSGQRSEQHKADDYTGPATDLLLKLRPNIRYFHSSQYINDLANGDICVAIGWAGDVWQAANRAKEAKNGVNVSYFIPKEGRWPSSTSSRCRLTQKQRRSVSVPQLPDAS
jgi:putrescine transport system substrate-binding protein